MSKLIVLTGLDGSGTTSVAQKLNELDVASKLLNGVNEPYASCRENIDRNVRDFSSTSHYLFYLAANVHASAMIEEALKLGNVYCVRYLIDTVVSHRVAGLDVNLDYETQLYKIRRPDLTLFLNVREEVRQGRLEKRGKGFLDKTLDDKAFRVRFLREFEKFTGHFRKIDVSSKSVLQIAEEIRLIQASL